MASKKFDCEVCKLTIKDQTSYESHLLGSKHQQALHKKIVNEKKEKCSVFITGFYNNAKKENIMQVFSKYGKIVDYFSEDPSRFVIIQYTDESIVQELLKTQIKFQGRILQIRRRQLKTNNNEKEPTKEDTSLPVLEAVNNCVNFDTQLNTLLKELQLPQRTVINMHLSLCHDIENSLSSKFPNCKAWPFGSTVAGLAFKQSDIDVYIEVIYHPKIVTPCNSLSSAYTKLAKNLLYKSRLFSNIVAIPNAKTPIVKCVHKATGVSCDMNFKNMLGLCNSNLIRYLLSLDARLNPLMMILKFWGKLHELTGCGKISNYGLSMLAIFYLQQLPNPILPPVAALQTRDSCKFCEGWNGGFSANPVVLHNALLSHAQNNIQNDWFGTNSQILPFVQDRVLSPAQNMILPSTQSCVLSSSQDKVSSCTENMVVFPNDARILSPVQEGQFCPSREILPPTEDAQSHVSVSVQNIVVSPKEDRVLPVAQEDVLCTSPEVLLPSQNNVSVQSSGIPLNPARNRISSPVQNYGVPNNPPALAPTQNRISTSAQNYGIPIYPQILSPTRSRIFSPTQNIRVPLNPVILHPSQNIAAPFMQSSRVPLNPTLVAPTQGRISSPTQISGVPMNPGILSPPRHLMQNRVPSPMRFGPSPPILLPVQDVILPPVQPRVMTPTQSQTSLSRGLNRASIPELLHGFFAYYAKFDYGFYVICPLSGRRHLKEDFTKPEDLPPVFFNYKKMLQKVPPLKTASVICLQDPFELTHNIAGNISTKLLEDFKRACEISADLCAQSALSNNDNLLKRLFNKQEILQRAVMSSDTKSTFKIPIGASLSLLEDSTEPTAATNAEERSAVLRRLWFDKINQFLVSVLTKVFLFEIVVKKAPSRSKSQKLEGQTDIHDVEIIDSVSFHCTGYLNVWDARKSISKNVSQALSEVQKEATTFLEGEIAVSDYIANILCKGIKVKDNIVDFNLTFNSRINPTEAEFVLENLDPKKKSFRQMAIFLSNKLPGWFERYLREGKNTASIKTADGGNKNCTDDNVEKNQNNEDGKQ